MRKLLSLLFILSVICVVGCAEKRPDPRQQEGFVDTSDPSKVMLPKLNEPTGPPKSK